MKSVLVLEALASLMKTKNYGGVQPKQIQQAITILVDLVIGGYVRKLTVLLH